MQSLEPRALGKSRMLMAAIKQLTALSLWTLREAVSKTGAPGYIEPVFVLHVPIRKRLVLRTQEDTRPIAMEEEVAKVVAIMVIAQTERYVSDSGRTREGGRREMWPAC